MDTYIVSVAKQGLYLVLILSAPPVITALVVGLTVSIIQATTQVQEQTLTFVPKLVCIILVLALLGQVGFALLIEYASSLLGSFSDYIG
ncbi:MAG: flagellar biosynthetic protein FliQ [Deltaproteobacteria bacterium]|nr:flagellar biosynthetic protein FliQ [Deltaproteobacteria bacterium]